MKMNLTSKLKIVQLVVSGGGGELAQHPTLQYFPLSPYSYLSITWNKNKVSNNIHLEKKKSQLKSVGIANFFLANFVLDNIDDQCF